MFDAVVSKLLREGDNDPRMVQFVQIFKQVVLQGNIQEDIKITPENVYQPARLESRPLLEKAMELFVQEGSRLDGVDQLLRLWKYAQEGKSCMILSEHLSNLDVPVMYYLVRKSGDPVLEEAFEHVIFIAGAKLNEESVIVKAFTEMFSRVVIVPRHYVEQSQTEEEMREATQINFRSVRKVNELKRKRYIFLMYPTGTRYRPWDPSTARGLPQATSYLRSFDYFLPVGISGCCLVPQQGNMAYEVPRPDKVVMRFGTLQRTSEFIEQVSKDRSFPSGEERKQFIVDRVMDLIQSLH